MRINITENNEIEKTNMRDIYCNEMIRMAGEDPRVYALDADLINSIGMVPFQKAFPRRIINCGVQEANMVGVAAGMSATGLIPFIHTFGVFASRRVFDQVFLSCGFSKWNVKIVGSDPGITAAYNGATHMPFEDMGIMRNVPGITVLEPTDCTMIENLMQQIKDKYGVYYVRLARKVTRKVYNPGSKFDIGSAVTCKKGTDITIISIGYCTAEALKAARILSGTGIEAEVLDMFTLKPIDKEAIIRSCIKAGAVVTAENHNIINGLGSAVAEVLGENLPIPMERIGIKDEYGEVGDIEYLAKRFGITADNIVSAVKRTITRKQESKN